MNRIIATLSVLVALAVISPSQAHALDCTEISSMIQMNVPAAVVVQTIQDSGSTFTADDVRCLETNGVPTEVLNAARSQMVVLPPATEGEAQTE